MQAGFRLHAVSCSLTAKGKIETKGDVEFQHAGAGGCEKAHWEEFWLRSGCGIIVQTCTYIASASRAPLVELDNNESHVVLGGGRRSLSIRLIIPKL